MSPDPATTRLLRDCREGDREAMDALFARLYQDLRERAHRELRRSSSDTLRTTALVHEAYLRLVDRDGIDARDRAHFLAVASRAMRFALVDYARAAGAQKRGGDRTVVPLETVQVGRADRHVTLLEVHEALEKLANADERLGRLVECRFFGGLSYDEVATVLDCSVRTAKRDWTRARAWLYRFLTPAPKAAD